jgi:protein SCO1
MRKIHHAVWIGATLVALILAGAILFSWIYLRDDGGVPKVAEIGGPFALVDHHGKSVTDRDYLGKPTLVCLWVHQLPECVPKRAT